MELDALAQAMVSFVVAGVLLLRGRQVQSHPSLLWGWGWIFFGVSQTMAMVLIFLINAGAAETFARSFVSLASTISILSAATWIYLGLHSLRSGRVFRPSELWLVITVLATVALITTLATDPLVANARLFWRVGVMRSLFVGLVFVTLGVGSIRAHQTNLRFRHRVLFGGVAAIWGLYLIAYFFLTGWNLFYDVTDTMAWRESAQPLETGLWALLALGMLSWVSGEEEVKRQQVEEDLREAKKQEAMGMLAGGVSHEFNNLSQAIQMAAESVQRAAARGDREGQARALDIIFDCCKQVGDMTSALLEYSRASQSDNPVSRDVSDLSATVRSNTQILSFVLPSNVNLSVEVPDREVLVPVSEVDLKTVILNLCINARDAMPHGGRLDVSISEGDSDETPMILRVQDSGAGIPANLHEMIFEPFFTTKPVGTGTGLGLSSVHGIVTAAGGSVGVQSEPGAGSEFTVRLPRATR